VKRVGMTDGTSQTIGASYVRVNLLTPRQAAAREARSTPVTRANHGRERSSSNSPISQQNLQPHTMHCEMKHVIVYCAGVAQTTIAASPSSIACPAACRLPTARRPL